MIELEVIVWVPPCVQERHAKGSESTELRVALFEVAQLLRELLDGDVFVEVREVPLGCGPRVVH